MAQYTGLSPLARGTREEYRLEGTGRRFIPAGAGNTMPITIANRANPVYPRWRGEHWDSSVSSLSLFGLSPLARGTH